MRENKTEEKVAPFHLKAKQVIQAFVRHESAVLFLVLVAMMAILAVVTKGRTATLSNMSNVWLQSATRGIAAIGQTFVLLTRGLDLSIGGIGLVGAVVGAQMMSEQTGFPVVAIGIMLLIGLGFGVLNGTLVTRIGMPALIVTLGMWRITDGMAYWITGGITKRFLPDSFNFIGGGRLAGVPVAVIIFIAIAVVSWFVLERTTYGRSVYAVGGNPVSAWLSGINVRRQEFSVYIIAGFCGALAGVILLSRLMAGGMNTVIGLEIDSIIAATIGGVSLAGGKGTVIGVVIGALILGVINNGMNVFAVSPAYVNIIKGWIIIVAVAIDYIRRR